MEFIKANKEDVGQCAKIIFDSELGQRYYPRMSILENNVLNGIENNEIFIAYSDAEKCVGIVWYQHNGIFHEFPFLHMIVVDSEVRGQGFGNKLMDFFEERVLYRGSKKVLRNKAFLLVADFNNIAKQMYKDRGYIEIGKVPNLFRKGIEETLMMKIVINNII